MKTEENRMFGMPTTVNLCRVRLIKRRGKHEQKNKKKKKKQKEKGNIKWEKNVC